jgi:hypothetical protein
MLLERRRHMQVGMGIHAERDQSGCLYPVVHPEGPPPPGSAAPHQPGRRTALRWDQGQALIPSRAPGAGSARGARRSRSTDR